LSPENEFIINTRFIKKSCIENYYLKLLKILPPQRQYTPAPASMDKKVRDYISQHIQNDSPEKQALHQMCIDRVPGNSHNLL